MSGSLKDTGCKPQSHGSSSPGGGPCPRCGRPRCTAAAKTRPGERCRKNPHPGAAICVNHGLTQAGRAAAAARRTELAAGELLESLVWNLEAAPVTDAVAALQKLAGRLQHAVDVLGGRLDVEQLDGPTAIAWTKVLRELRQALVSMERLDLDSKQLVIDGALAEVVVGAYRASVAAVVLLPADRERLLSTFLGKLGDVVPGEVVA